MISGGGYGSRGVGRPCPPSTPRWRASKMADGEATLMLLSNGADRGFGVSFNISEKRYRVRGFEWFSQDSEKSLPKFSKKVSLWASDRNDIEKILKCLCFKNRKPLKNGDDVSISFSYLLKRG